MSYVDGWSAINLQMPARVPRIEFSITEYHYELMNVVTGLNVSPQSSEAEKQVARSAFVKAWNYDLVFSALIGNSIFGKKQSPMGHAVYAADGSDFDTNIRNFVTTPEEALSIDFWETYGPINQKELTKMFEDQYRQNCQHYPESVNMSGIYPGLITGLTFILGWDLLLETLGTDARAFGELLNRYAQWMQQYYDALAEADIPVIYSHDDQVWTEGAFYDPAWYRTYVFPNIKRYWAPLRESGKKIIFVCDGNYTQFAHDIAACGNHGFWFEIFTDLAYMTEHFGQSHFLIGNADTRILLNGTKQDITQEVERCMHFGKKCPGYFMAVSNHIPANTPIDAALWYNEEYIRLSRR